ncbi:polyphosphate polymerase domain-containing protein [Streptococcus halotolerans]|uniref:polyphosphate polymerase domain-containing protein n=1 Tax=Streptococcus halotolerans TaxID=1814128 RepID=UPI000787179C|nr:polyphosphate polymerase domain-containing protein [Streptococcus halotolerans]
MNEVLRQEKKYLITIEDYYRLSEQFSQLMTLDSHSSGDGYCIRSLYFDSLEDVDWHEKDDGVDLRRKIRFRNYGSHSQFAKLEMKQKQGANQKKRSLRLSREDAQELIRGNHSVLLSYPDDFAAECYALMSMKLYRPKTVIEYQRKAFVAKENNIRITFDHHIIGTESCYDIFSENLNQNYLLNPYLVILEVKYNGFLLSYIKELLTSIDGSELSASKYCMGRAISKHYRF